MWGRGLALGLVVGAVIAAVGSPGAPRDLGQWSDPVVIAETTVAARPVLLTTARGFQVFWLDRRNGTIELRQVALDATRPGDRSGTTLASGVDGRFGWPVATVVGDHVHVLWMRRGAETVQLMGAVVDERGTVLVAPRPLGPIADESGSLAILSVRERVHVAWSQFDHGQRRIWYLQLAADGQPLIVAHPVALGESPTLVAGDPIHALWWQSGGFDSYRLMTANLTAGILTDQRPLTPSILQGQVSPPVGGTGPDGLDVLFTVVERGFGTRERLYHLRLGKSGPSPREAFPEIQSAGEVAGALVDDQPIVIWTAPAGRSGHLEVFTARFDSAVQDVERVVRVAYSPGGSRLPAITAGPEAFSAAWLEVVGVTRFRLVVATTANARPRRFLLGVPELDLSRPVQLGLFAGTVAATILPYTLIYVVGFALIAMALIGLWFTVFGEFGWVEVLRVRRGIRLALFLVTAWGLESLSRVVIPGAPAVGLLAAAMVGPGVLVGLAVNRGYWPQPLQFWGVAVVVLWVQLMIVLFPWGVHQLSQF